MNALAPKLADQGWAGLLPILAPDATPNVRLSADKAELVTNGRGKAPGIWSRSGWSLLRDWREHPDDVDTIETWAQWPRVNVGMRACHRSLVRNGTIAPLHWPDSASSNAAPWVAFIDGDVLHHEAAAEILAMLRRRLDGHGDFIWRVGQAPKFLVPVQVTEPVKRDRSTVVEVDGQKHMVELLGQGQQAVVAGIHPKTGRAYVWPEGGLEFTEPGKLPLVTPAELAEILAACSRILLRYGTAVGRKGRSVNSQSSAQPKDLSELRAKDKALALSAAEFVINADWTYDDWVEWAYALRGAFGDDGQELWLRFSAQSAKHDADAAEKVWADASRAELADQLRAGAGTIIRVAREEGFTPPPPPGLPAYFDGGDQDATQARADLRLAVIQWGEQGLAYKGRGQAPRDAIAGGVGLGKTTVTLEVLANTAQGKTVHYYTPTLDLGAEVVSKANAIGLDAVLVRGREANKKDPVRWPALCQKDDVAATLARAQRNVWESLCRKEDDFGNVTTCEFFHSCSYVGQFNELEGKLVVLAHEYLTLPKALIAKPALAVVDERFHATLVRTPSLPLGRVTAERPAPDRTEGWLVAELLAHDAGRAIRAVEAGKSMASIGLSPERLRLMAKTEDELADPPTIWPDMAYAEQRTRAQRLHEIEAFKLAKLWRVLAQDHDRVTQRVVVRRGIEWKGGLQDRAFIYSATAPTIPKGLPVLLLDADHDPLIGAATVPTNRRTAILPAINAEVVQVSDTACSKNKLMNSPTIRAQVLALARHESAQGRRVLVGTYKPVADLLRAELAEAPNPDIEIAHFGAIRGLDGWKDFDTVIVAGREQPKAVDVENMARCLFGADPEPLLLTGEYVQQMRGHLMKDGARTAVIVQVHPDLRVQALLEQTREREIEQMVGRLRLVHRDRPARVLVLSNLPTALPVDRFTTWAGVMPGKVDQAIVAGRGVLPLSYSELARVHPGLWAKVEDARWGVRQKGGVNPLRDSYWNYSTLWVATLVTYRLPEKNRGSPHRAIIPGWVRCPEKAALALAPLLCAVVDVRIVKTLHRPGAGVIEDETEPSPVRIPIRVSAPFHVLDVDEAWAFAGHDCQRWTLHTGKRVVLPVALAGRFALALRSTSHPTAFARGAA